MILTKNKMFHDKRYLLLFIIAVFLSLSFLLFNRSGTAEAASTPCIGTHAPPYSATEMNDCVPGAVRNNILNSDADTRRRLIENDTTTACTQTPGTFAYRRCRINFTRPYTTPTWLSIRNQPTEVTASVAPSTAINLSLQINQIKFLSSSLNPTVTKLAGDASLYGSDRPQDIQWMNGDFPRDRSPYLFTPQLNHAAQRSRNVHYIGASVVSGGGSVSFPSSNTMLMDHQSTSRYWFGRPVALNYSRAGITSSTTVTINVRYKAITESGAIYHCEGNSNISKTGLNDSVADCPEGNANLTFTVVVPTTWDYRNNTLDTDPSLSTSTPYPRIPHGRTIDFDNTIRNVGNGTGAEYRHGLQVRIGSGAWNFTGTNYAHASLASGAERTREWSYTVPNSVANDTQICFRAVVNPSAGQSSPTLTITRGNTFSQIRCLRAYTPPPVPTCGNLIQSPRPAEVGEDFSARISFAYGSFPTGVTFSYEIWLTVEGNVLSRTRIASGSVSGGPGGTLIETVDPLSGTIPGLHNATFEINFGGESVTCNSDVLISAKPYFRVYGGNVKAGWNFEDSTGTCTANPSSRIIAYNKGGSDWGGAGTQLAAFAVDSITGFVSAAGRTTAPTPLKNLTFANSTAQAYGGELDGVHMKCPPDYFSAAAGPVPGGDFGSLNGIYETPGNYTIGSGSGRVTINPGRRITLYVGGDLSIRNRIEFVNTNYSNLAALPSVRIIVRGNIYIHPSVQRIDAVLIAQPDGSGIGGEVYTCSNAAMTGPPNRAQLNNECQNTRLTIYGSVIARRVHLLRTQGSLRNATNAENRDTGDAAEQFIYSPELWLVPPFPGSGDSGYEAFTVMPPIL
jgi:hypothetical protein